MNEWNEGKVCELMKFVGERKWVSWFLCGEEGGNVREGGLCVCEFVGLGFYFFPVRTAKAVRTYRFSGRTIFNFFFRANAQNNKETSCTNVRKNSASIGLVQSHGKIK